MALISKYIIFRVLWLKYVKMYKYQCLLDSCVENNLSHSIQADIIFSIFCYFYEKMIFLKMKISIFLGGIAFGTFLLCYLIPFATRK